MGCWGSYPRSCAWWGAARWWERWSHELRNVLPGPMHGSSLAPLILWVSGDLSGERCVTPVVLKCLLAWTKCWGYGARDMSVVKICSLLQERVANGIFAPCCCFLCVHQARSTAFLGQLEVLFITWVPDGLQPWVPGTSWGGRSLLWVQVRISPGKRIQGQKWPRMASWVTADIHPALR